MAFLGASLSHGSGRVWSSSVDLVAKKKKKKPKFLRAVITALVGPSLLAGGGACGSGRGHTTAYRLSRPNAVFHTNTNQPSRHTHLHPPTSHTSLSHCLRHSLLRIVPLSLHQQTDSIDRLFSRIALITYCTATSLAPAHAHMSA